MKNGRGHPASLRATKCKYRKPQPVQESDLIFSELESVTREKG
ncbi:MAG TPA: hypothetical protein VI864_04940 [Candidatus Bathyarchaeia archaeon]|nr:hypothetical protein [Candidatus Bathyarchaeia archaeon]